MAVVLSMKMQYGFKIIPMVICNRYFGVLKIYIYTNQFFDRNSNITPPCWSKAGNGVKFGLIALS